MGGDGFLVMLGGVRDLDGAAAIAERIGHVAGRSVEIPGAVTISLSTGVTVRRAGEDPDSLIASSDQTMYTARSGARTQVIEIT